MCRSNLLTRSRLNVVFRVAYIVEVVVVAVTLIVIAYQTYQQAAFTRAANVHSLSELMTTLNMRLTEPEMAELWEYSHEIPGICDEKVRTVKESQYTTLLANQMIFHENVYSQYEADLIPKQIYDGWDADLQGLIANQPIEDYWNDWRGAYQENFRNHIDALIKAKPSPSPSPSPSPCPSPSESP